jgi:hypothetical protein
VARYTLTVVGPAVTGRAGGGEGKSAVNGPGAVREEGRIIQRNGRFHGPQYRPWGRTKAVLGHGRFEDFPFRPFSAHGQRACARPVGDLGKSSRARNSGDSAPPARDGFPLAAEKGGNGLTPTSRRFQTLPFVGPPGGRATRPPAGPTVSFPFAITLILICRKVLPEGRSRLRAIHLGAIACKHAPPNRVNLLSKANWSKNHRTLVQVVVPLSWVTLTTIVRVTLKTSRTSPGPLPSSPAELSY